MEQQSPRLYAYAINLQAICRATTQAVVDVEVLQWIGISIAVAFAALR
jgi:hypothetical protein